MNTKTKGKNLQIQIMLNVNTAMKMKKHFSVISAVQNVKINFLG